MIGTLTNLLKEHERALVQLTFLNDAASRIYQQGYSFEDMNVISHSVDYISLDFLCHCENEEREIYQGLGNFLPEASLQEFRDEHKKITQFLETLRELMSGVSKSFSGDSKALELRLKASELTHIFSRHIKRENDSFYLMASHILPEGNLKQIFRNWKLK
ncbi:MAG: hemerythrin domain-containing protein [Ignavibacteria bacterium]|jgi:hemerythrin-like domain-containing protein|nr:hemerythrin domain-containing protein [Ignavibacteria bacterium]MCU7504855.1 hemerythrin domain-containing protein [Ignavibacteria bacterium]MCU7518333.1 hemerythrin domain-containing protein [Ignavibacteria bacterium]